MAKSSKQSVTKNTDELITKSLEDLIFLCRVSDNKKSEELRELVTNAQDYWLYADKDYTKI